MRSDGTGGAGFPALTIPSRQHGVNGLRVPQDSGLVRVSVITATLNRRDMLQRAIESVLDQRIEPFEHIIVDGASTDGTIEMLSKFPHLKVVSEPDRGVYSAWNKGLRRANGDLFCMLNSDDTLPPGALKSALAALSVEPTVDLISGPVEIATAAHGREEVRLIDDEDILSLREQDIGPGIPITNGRYMHRRLVERVGLFDERYRLVSDRDYLTRIRLAQPHHIVLSCPLYRYHAHAGSLTLSGPSASQALVDEAIVAARNGYQEAASASARAAYRRWHAWAVWYGAAFALRRGEGRKAGSILSQGFGADRFWPALVPAPTMRHWQERHARRGRLDK